MDKRDGFKKGINANHGARKREHNIVVARQERREHGLIQRRRTQSAQVDQSAVPSCDSSIPQYAALF
jgi:hypothetical protein